MHGCDALDLGACVHLAGTTSHMWTAGVYTGQSSTGVTAWWRGQLIVTSQRLKLPAAACGRRHCPSGLELFPVCCQLTSFASFFSVAKFVIAVGPFYKLRAWQGKSQGRFHSRCSLCAALGGYLLHCIRLIQNSQWPAVWPQSASGCHALSSQQFHGVFNIAHVSHRLEPAVADTFVNDFCIVTGTARRDLKTGSGHYFNAVGRECEIRVIVPQSSVGTTGCDLNHAVL